MALTLSNPFLLRNIPPPTLSLTPATTKLGLNRSRVTCRKKDIHPEFYEDAKVYCNGEMVLTVGGTKKEYVVDVWSGNHPYYLGGRSSLMVEDDQLTKFRKKYAGLDWMMEIPVLKGELIIPPGLKSLGKRKKK